MTISVTPTGISAAVPYSFKVAAGRIEMSLTDRDGNAMQLTCSVGSARLLRTELTRMIIAAELLAEMAEDDANHSESPNSCPNPPAVPDRSEAEP